MDTVRLGVLAALAVAVILVGCQQPGKVVSSQPSVECPICHERLVTSRIAGINFKEFDCPDCGKEYVPPEGFYGPDTTAYYCPKCQAVVATCPSCLKKALPPAVLAPMKSY